MTDNFDRLKNLFLKKYHKGQVEILEVKQETIALESEIHKEQDKNQEIQAL